MADANFPTGRNGLIAIDKVGNRVLFLDPDTLAVETTLEGFAPRVHELAISPDHRTAYVPIYGDGIHGDNPHPGHLIAVFDLAGRRHAGDISTAPHLAPHGLRWGAEGQLYCVCENSGVVLEMDAASGAIRHVIEVGSDKAHRIEVLPDGSRLYTENEEDLFASVVDLATRQRIGKIALPHGSAGIALSPDGTTIILVDAKQPDLLVVDTATDRITRTIRLDGHEAPAQIARYSPDGRFLVVTSHDAPLCTILDAGLGTPGLGTPELDTQRLVQLPKGPMNMAFHPDGETVVVANQDAGSLSVVSLTEAEVRRTVPVGCGIETLSFF